MVERGLAADVEALARTHQATISVWLGGLSGTAWFARDEHVIHHAASTMKLPLVIALHRGAEAGGLSLDEEILVADTLASSVEGRTYVTTQAYDNDEQPWQRLGRPASLRWLAERAIISSSNLATNLLIDRIGIDAVNEVYDLAGATTARLRRPIQDGPGANAHGENSATAADMAAVLVGLSTQRLTGPEAAVAVEAVLAADEFNDAIPAGLPPGTYCAHKTGWIEHVCHDVALVRPDDEEPFVLCILTGAALADGSIHRLVADVAATCWRHRQEVAR